MDKKKTKKELVALIKEGASIHFANVLDYDKDYFKKFDNKGMTEYAKKRTQHIENPRKAYQFWYSKAYRMVRIFIPERLEEFETLYGGNKTIKSSQDLSPIMAGIKHYIEGWVITQNDKQIDFFETYLSGVIAQITILETIIENFDDSLFNFERDIHHEFYKSEIDIAKDIQDQGHLKIAGAVAGVIIEAHLKTLVANKNIPIKTHNNKPPTMDDYNTALKKDDAYDTATWRLIQRCGDIRNDCAHSNEDKPTKEETDDIIRAAEQIIADYN